MPIVHLGIVKAGHGISEIVLVLFYRAQPLLWLYDFA